MNKVTSYAQTAIEYFAYLVLYLCRFTFECKLECDCEPKITWFKDDLALASPDYERSYSGGFARLTIEETFSEDTARYTCKATTDGGEAQTSAQLVVKGKSIMSNMSICRSMLLRCLRSLKPTVMMNNINDRNVHRNNNNSNFYSL